MAVQLAVWLARSRPTLSERPPASEAASTAVWSLALTMNRMLPSMARPTMGTSTVPIITVKRTTAIPHRLVLWCLGVSQLWRTVFRRWHKNTRPYRS